MTTLRDIARRLGVSQTTVSLALRGDPRISAARREAVRAEAQRLGYRAPAVLREAMAQVRQGRRADFHGNLAILVDGPEPQAAHSAFLGSISARARDLGYVVDRLSLDPFYENPSALVRCLVARGIRGLLVLRSISAPLGLNLGDALARWPRVVVGDTRAEWAEGTVVSHNLHTIARRCCREALARGYRRLGVCVPFEEDVDHAFAASVHEYVRRQGLPVLPPFTFADEEPEISRDRFLGWWTNTEADCLIGDVQPFVAQAHQVSTVPEESGLITWRATAGDDFLTGIDRRDADLARTSVDVLVASLQQAVVGLSVPGTLVQVEHGWFDGRSLRPVRPLRIGGDRGEVISEGDAEPVPLQTACNQTRELWLGDRPLPSIPPGRTHFNGVPFLIVDESAARPSFVLFRSRTLSHGGGHQLPIGLRLPLGYRVRSVVLLHGCGRVRGREHLGTWSFSMGSGSSHHCPIVALGWPGSTPATDLPPNLQDWYWELPSVTSEAAQPVQLNIRASALAETAHLYTLVWSNPDPTDPVMTMTYTALPQAEASYALFAITALRT